MPVSLFTGLAWPPAFRNFLISHLLHPAEGKFQNPKWSLKNFTLIVGFEIFEKGKKKKKYKELINYTKKKKKKQ